jgi:hypothetical protein
MDSSGHSLLGPLAIVVVTHRATNKELARGVDPLEEVSVSATGLDGLKRFLCPQGAVDTVEAISSLEPKDLALLVRHCQGVVACQ